MRSLCLAAASGLILLGAAGVAAAQPHPIPPPDPAMSYRIVRVLPDPPPPLSDTRRDGLGAEPGCGMANPQDHIPTATTWGQCP